MKLAFLVLAHKNPAQLERLIDYLRAKGCPVYVHIDKKRVHEFDRLFKKYEGHDHVRMFSRFKVYWGGYSQIKATFFLLEKAVAEQQFDFVSLISGQDLPVTDPATFGEFLSHYRDRSFLAYYSLPASERLEGRGGLDRVENFWLTAFPKGTGFFFNPLLVIIHFFQKKMKLYKKSPVPLYGGANWFTLNREMAEYVTGLLTRNPAVMRWYRFTRCADEIILQTILMNSPFREKVENRCLRFIDWTSGPEYPRTLRMEDKERLIDSGEFIARKFDEQVDNSIIDYIYSKI